MAGRASRKFRGQQLRAAEVREDVTALIVAKLIHIHEDNEAGVQNFMEELRSDPVRMGNCLLGMLGIVTQYAMGTTRLNMEELAQVLIRRLDDREDMWDKGLRSI